VISCSNHELAGPEALSLSHHRTPRHDRGTHIKL
jgi:hypothetical protein